MATAVTLGHGGSPANIDLNNQASPTGYFIDPEGFLPGGYLAGGWRVTWDEVPSYAGGVAQVNVQKKNLIPVTIPMSVRSNSVANLNTALASLWTLVDTCTYADPGTLQIASETSMTIVNSTLPEDLERSTIYELQFRAYFTLVLMRKP
jgi:hypothetical protein